MMCRTVTLMVLSCILLAGQTGGSSDERFKFAEGVTNRYKTTGADKEFGYCTVTGHENRTFVHIIPGLQLEKARMLLSSKRLHGHLYTRGFTVFEFRSDPNTVVLGATITPTGFVLYNTKPEIPFLDK